MRLIAAARPAVEPGPYGDERVLAEADDIIVRALFDEIVGTLLTPSTARDAGAPELPGRLPGPLETRPPATSHSPRLPHSGWARAPPQTSSQAGE